MQTFEVKINFIRDLLGSQPANEEIRKKYITAKIMTGRTGDSAEIAMDKVQSEIDNYQKDETTRVEEVETKGLTVFYRDEKGRPSLSDIQIRGFMKDAFAFVGKKNKWLTKKSGEAYSTDDAYKKYIGERLSFEKQYYPLIGEITMLERPLRVMTMQGPRVGLASSELAKAPQTILVRLKIDDDEFKKDYLDAIFSRGEFKGISQWANAQYGTFNYELMKV